MRNGCKTYNYLLVLRCSFKLTKKKSSGDVMKILASRLTFENRPEKQTNDGKRF